MNIGVYERLSGSTAKQITEIILSLWRRTDRTSGDFSDFKKDIGTDFLGP
jgi:hypothetical protein